MATLAGIPNATSAYNPILHPKDSEKRRNWVLQRMYDSKTIDKETYDRASAEPLKTNPGSKAVDKFPYFTDALRRDLTSYYQIKESDLNQAGWRVTTTLDIGIQQACDKALREGLMGVERQWQLAKPERHTEEVKDWNGVLHEDNVMLMRITGVRENKLTVNLDRYNGTIDMPDPSAFYEPANVVKVGEWIDVRVKSWTSAGARSSGFAPTTSRCRAA